MDLIDSIAELAGSRCSSFHWNQDHEKMTFVVTGRASLMHHLITRAQVAGDGFRLLKRSTRPLGDGLVEVRLDYQLMGIERRDF